MQLVFGEIDAITISAPAMRAPCTAASPTAPQPITITASP
jgi:hypothetical protein